MLGQRWASVFGPLSIQDHNEMRDYRCYRIRIFGRPIWRPVVASFSLASNRTGMRRLVVSLCNISITKFFKDLELNSQPAVFLRLIHGCPSTLKMTFPSRSPKTTRAWCCPCHTKLDNTKDMALNVISMLSLRTRDSVL